MLIFGGNVGIPLVHKPIIFESDLSAQNRAMLSSVGVPKTCLSIRKLKILFQYLAEYWSYSNISIIFGVSAKSYKR